MPEEIFISYARKDRERAGPIVELFRDKGYSYWMDEGNIEAARLWSEQIVQAIKECEVLVLLVSENSLASDNVHKEVMLASETNKRILPIYLEPCDLPDRFRYQLAGIQHIEFYDLNSEKVRSKICSCLEEGSETMLSEEGRGYSKKTLAGPAARLRKLGLASFWTAVVPIVLLVLYAIVPFSAFFVSIVGLILILSLVEVAALVMGVISRKTVFGKVGLWISSSMIVLSVLAYGMFFHLEPGHAQMESSGGPSISVTSNDSGLVISSPGAISAGGGSTVIPHSYPGKSEVQLKTRQRKPQPTTQPTFRSVEPSNIQPPRSDANVKSFEIKGLVMKLSGAVNPRSMSIDLVLEGETADFEKMIKEYESKLRHEALELMSSYDYEECQSDGFMERVSSDLIKRYATVLPKTKQNASYPVTKLYFTKFLIQ